MANETTTSRTVTVRLPEGIYQRLELKSEKSGIAVATLARLYIVKALELGEEIRI